MLLPMTKEKGLALAALAAAALMLSSLRLPKTEPAPEVLAQEAARTYSVIGGTLSVSPEKELTGGRDPFQVQDAWSEAAPATLEIPPAVRWPRALPGGAFARPTSPAQRRIQTEEQ